MKTLLSQWSFSLSALLTMAGSALLYRTINGSWRPGNSNYLLAASLIIIVCLCSPLKILSDQYLFSVHMAVHVLLLLVAGPMLVLSFQDKKRSAVQTFILKHPFLGWLTGVGIMWLWHIPFLFNLLMQYSHQPGVAGTTIKMLEPLSLVLSGMLFSLPIISKSQEKLPAPSGIIYLFTACLGCSLLGLLITFAPPGTYRHFLSADDVGRLNPLILHRWKIDQATDQQAAGLIMWVPCCLVYISGAMLLLKTWLKTNSGSLSTISQGSTN